MFPCVCVCVRTRTYGSIEVDDVREPPCDDGGSVPGQRDGPGCHVPHREVLRRVLRGCNTHTHIMTKDFNQTNVDKPCRVATKEYIQLGAAQLGIANQAEDILKLLAIGYITLG